MSDETSFLAPGPFSRISPDLHITGPIGRIGDGLVYTARDGAREARVREYAPPGAVQRGGDGLLRPVDARFEHVWREGVAHFLRQAGCLAEIRHPGVAPVWRAAGSAEAGEPPFLVGAPAGESLGAALARGLPLSPAGIIRIANELAAALAEVHARGLTHLDVNPDTVSISSGRLQLSDFGVDNRGFMPLLQSQDGLVRPGFSPIELYDGARAEPLGPPADIYAASALIFTLITGRAPAPWQERWRDPSASQLADRDAYPPPFIEAVRRGLAIEPDDRYRDGTEWLAALSGGAVERSAPAPARVAAPPPPPPAPIAPPQDPGRQPAAATPPAWQPVAAPSANQSGFAPARPDPGHPAQPPYVPPRRRSGGIVPWLVLGLILLALAAGALFAYQQGWFTPVAEEPVENRSKPRPERAKERRQETSIPRIEVGGTVSGQLTRRDPRRPSGQHQDSFTLAGRSGQRLELRLASTDFDPLLSMTGSGFSAANDDDAEQGSTNSRLLVTLPRTGTYTINVSSYAAGQTGNYVLEVAEPRVEASIVTPAMLTGRWRRPDDMGCSDPATIRVDGAQLEYSFRDFSTVGRLLDGVGRTIRAEMEDGPDGGGEAAFLMAEDGGSFTIEGETWLRC